MPSAIFKFWEHAQKKLPDMNLEIKEVTLNVHCGYETIKLFYFCGQLTQWSKCGKKIEYVT